MKVPGMITGEILGLGFLRRLMLNCSFFIDLGLFGLSNSTQLLRCQPQ